MIEDIIAIARDAGQIVLEVYNSGDFETTMKLDLSPLTRADLESNRAICDALAPLGIPIVSEEATVDYRVRRAWKRLWLVDPLDGSHDFVAGNAEFCINIALVESGRPVLGVIYAPVYDDLFYAQAGRGAHLVRGGVTTRLPTTRLPELIMARSRLNGIDAAARFAERNEIHAHCTISSAIKFGRLAMGEVSVYPRYEESKEWDTAAGQIILHEAGGQIVDVVTGAAPRYNKPDIRNNHFVACAPGVDLASFTLEESQ